MTHTREAPWAKIPRDLYLDMGASRGDIAVYCEIDYLCGKRGYYYVGYDVLAERLGVSDRTVRRAVGWLVERSYLNFTAPSERSKWRPCFSIPARSAPVPEPDHEEAVSDMRVTAKKQSVTCVSQQEAVSDMRVTQNQAVSDMRVTTLPIGVPQTSVPNHRPQSPPLPPQPMPAPSQPSDLGGALPSDEIRSQLREVVVSEMNHEPLGPSEANEWGRALSTFVAAALTPEQLRRAFTVARTTWSRPSNATPMAIARNLSTLLCATPPVSPSVSKPDYRRLALMQRLQQQEAERGQSA